LQVRGRSLAALAHHVVADLLAFDEPAHAGALDRGDVDEHVGSALVGWMKPKPLCKLKNFTIPVAAMSGLPCTTPNGVNGPRDIARASRPISAMSWKRS
jgi:hypothetical protein